MLKFKCWYYTQAMEDGNEDKAKACIPDGLPKDIRQAYDNSHKSTLVLIAKNNVNRKLAIIMSSQNVSEPPQSPLPSPSGTVAA